MNVLAIQPDIVWEDKPANHGKVLRLLDAARPEPGSLVVLPEMFASGFSRDVSAVSDSPRRETQEFLTQTARDRSIHLLGGVVTTGTDGRGRNEAVLIDPQGRETGRYAKMHLFGFAGESEHCTAGTTPGLWRCQEFTVAPAICYDLRFPELFRAGVRQGAEVFCVIANWPTVRVQHWLTLLKARAIENQAYVIGVNRCGRDPSLAYPGRSQIIDPRGEVLADAGDAEGVIRAALDLSGLRDYRREFPALNDMI